jgi:hypothetical protein
MEQFEKLLATPEPPELGPGPRAGVEPQGALNRALEELLARAKLPPGQPPLIRALVLLWHDHLDAAHVIAQEIENADGAFVHGIMHRREPDYGNAKYWFRRVGKHPAFPEITTHVTALLTGKDEPGLRDELASQGNWDPFGFVDACERANRRSGAGERSQLLREIQALESRVLLDRFCRPEP